VEADNVAVFVHLFHDLIIHSFAEIPLFFLKENLKEVPLTVIPDRYSSFLGHKTVPFLIASVRYAQDLRSMIMNPPYMVV